MENVRQETKSITQMAVLVALVFIATYTVKIPTLHGYTHPGDSMIFLAVLILGTKKGALAGSIGAALSDLIGGYAQWILPTFVIKFGMAALMGIITNKLFPNLKFGWIIGSILGGLFQIISYTFANFAFFGTAYALSGIIPLFFQTGIGLFIAIILVAILKKSNALSKLKEM